MPWRLPARQPGNEDGVAIVMFADTPLVSAASLKQLADGVKAGAWHRHRRVRGLMTRQATDGLSWTLTAPSAASSRTANAANAERAIGLCNGGIMAVSRSSLFTWLDRVTNDNAKGEYYLTDIVAIAQADGAVTSPPCRDRRDRGDGRE